VWALVAAIFAARVLEATTGFSLLYYTCLNSVFLLAGIVAALEAPSLIFRQIRFFLLLCLPLMCLQVAGAGEWTQALNTEYWITEEDVGAAKTVYPMLFKGYEDVTFNYGVGQGRPAGLMHANNVLSLIIIFGFALQFGRVRRARVTWTDALLVACMVLAMAKIVLLCVLLMLLWMWMMRDAVSRARATGIFWLTLIGYGIYALLFPGLFELQLSGAKILYSFSVRVIDVLETFSALDDSQRSALLNMMGDAHAYNYASDEDVGTLSGYAMLLRVWPLLVGAGVVLTPLFFAGLARARRQSGTIAATAFAAAVAVVLFPAAVPFFRAQLYWFIFGFAAVPFVTLVAPQFVERLVARGRAGDWGAR
jgi:hypothetical protein